MFVPPRTIFLSTTSRLVFIYDRIQNRYDSDFYRPELTQEQVSSNEVTSFIKEADTIALSTMAKAIKYQKFVVAGFCLLIILAFIGAFADVDGLVKAGIGLLIAYFFASIAYFILYEKKKKKEISFRIRALLNQHNEIIAARGWRWSVPHHFNTIELCRIPTNENYNATPDPVPAGLVITFRQTPYYCGYNARVYTSEQTENKLTKQEAEIFMNEVNTIAAGTIQTTGRITMILIFLMVIAFLVAIGGGMSHNDGLFKAGALIVVFGSLVGSAVIYLHYQRKRGEMEKRMKILIDHNNSSLHQRGLGWYCPSSLLRIDLIKYYKAMELVRREVIINPQVANNENVSEILSQSVTASEVISPDVNASDAPVVNNDDVVLNLVEIPGYDNMDNMSLVNNDNVGNNISAIDETDLTQNMFPVNDNDETKNNNNDDDEA